MGEAIQTMVSTMQELMKSGAFSVTACDRNYDFDDKSRFLRLKIDEEQQGAVNMLINQFPEILESHTLQNAYVMTNPKGLQGTVMQLKQGGYSSKVVDGNNHIVGDISYVSLDDQAALLGAFSALSVATGQYFLAEINDKLRSINLKLDDILKFLYGDKKAELLSEMSFVRSAYENYKSVMNHEQQRVAVLTNLVQARIIAMQDIEFYIVDLDSKVNQMIRVQDDIKNMHEKAMRIKECLDFSERLYIMSSIMEIYYSQNFNNEYLENVEADMLRYIDKYENRIIAAFSTLKSNVSKGFTITLPGFDRHKYISEEEKILSSYRSGEESVTRKSARKAIHAMQSPETYYLTSEGKVYLKIA